MDAIHRRRLRRWLALTAASIALHADTSLAVFCEALGINAPAVVTLMASRTDSANEAWIVAPDCSLNKEVLHFGALAPLSYNIERVESIPTATTSISLIDNPLSRGADFSRASKLTNVILQNVSPTLIDKLVVPSSLTFLTLMGSSVSSIASLRLPPLLQSLNLPDNGLTTLKGVQLPVSLSSLSLDNNKLTSIDFVIPPNLLQLSLSGNSISKLGMLSFPNSIGSLDVSDNAITLIQGVELPLSLGSLDVRGNPITMFEIREADRKAMAQLTSFDADFTLASCSNPAKSILVKAKKICLISDQLFSYLYRGGSDPGSSEKKPAPTVTTQDTAGSGGKVPSGGSQSNGEKTGPGVVESAGSSTEPVSGGTALKSAASSNGSEPLEDESSSVSGDSSLPRRPKHTAQGASGPTSSTSELGSERASNSTLWVVAIAGGCIVALLFAFTGYRLYRYAQSRQRLEDKAGGLSDEKDGTASTPSEPFHYDAEPADDVYLTNDIRIDRALIPFRIELRKLPLGESIAQGKASVIYHATFQGRDVAVKQLLPGVWQNERALASFMAEIRMCSSLEHHKIVGFVGIAWSSARDISAVTEFMPGGDLNTLLLKQQSVPQGRDWFEPWTSAAIKCKVGIAQDVAEALVYLHSYKNPILHRNLKTHNVLLDLHGNAKLSDFGISRVSSFDETMTGEIGTAAWIAPEVLRGERYSEQADIYSLGVLLVELDRCRHPYASEIAVPSETERASSGILAPEVSYKNTQIAVLVSAGKLRPSVTSSCPASVASLVDRCLSFDAGDRPTAMGVYYALRQARKALGHSVSFNGRSCVPSSHERFDLRTPQ